MQQEEKKLVELSWPLSINGNVASNLLQYFNYAHTKNPSNELKPNTKAWLFYQLKKPENEYTIENLYNIHKGKFINHYFFIIIITFVIIIINIS